MLRAMQARSAFSLVLALACVAVSGCAYGEVRQVIRAQFASELSCPEVTLRRRDIWYSYDGPDQYKVEGCGVMRTYTCPASNGLVSYDEPACTWVEGDADAPKLAKTAPDADEGGSTDADEASPPDADEELDRNEAHDAADDDHAGGAADDDHASASSEGGDDEPAKPAKAAGKVKAAGSLELGAGVGKKK